MTCALLVPAACVATACGVRVGLMGAVDGAVGGVGVGGVGVGGVGVGGVGAGSPASEAGAADAGDAVAAEAASAGCRTGSGTSAGAGRAGSDAAGGGGGGGGGDAVPMASVTSLVWPCSIRVGALNAALPALAWSSQYCAALQSSTVNWVPVTLQGCKSAACTVVGPPASPPAASSCLPQDANASATPPAQPTKTSRRQQGFKLMCRDENWAAICS